MQSVWSRPGRAAALRWLLLAGFVGVVYLAVLGGLGGWLWPSGRATLALSFLAAAISAAGAGPMLRLVDLMIRRTLLHQTLTPYRALAEAARLPAAAESASEGLPVLARLLAEAAGARTASVWLLAEGALVRVAEWSSAPPAEPSDPPGVADLDALRGLPGVDHAVPIDDGRGARGALVIGKHGPVSVTAEDDRLLRDAANSAGLLLRTRTRNAELRNQLREAEKLELELGSSRERLLRARDLERRRVVTEITVVTTDSLAVIAGELGNLDLALSAGPGDADRVLRRVQPALDDLIDRFRAVVRGVYPGVLRDAGPRAALEELATGLPRSILITGGLDARAGWELESGLYYAAAGALNLLGRQRSEHPLRVHIGRVGGRIEVRVEESAPEPGAGAALRAALANDVDRLAALGGGLGVRQSAHRIGLHAWLPDESAPGAPPDPDSAVPADPAAVVRSGPAPRRPADPDTVVRPGDSPDSGLPLLDRVRALVRAACEQYVEGPIADELGEVAGRLDEPLRVALVGRIKSGKTTLLNALVGQELADTGTTRLPTWYRYGPSCRLTLYPRHGPPRRLDFASTGAAASVPPAERLTEADRVVVDWPAEPLRSLTLIDSPGLDSPSGAGSARTRELLAPRDGALPTADAVIYLMRQLRDPGVDGLGVGDGAVAVGVLSRADELAGCAPGALDSAREQIERHRADPALRRLCQTVVPIAGLLSASEFSLRDNDFRTVSQLARLDAAVTDRLLLSATDFVHATPRNGSAGHGPMPAVEARSVLLDRLGVYGVRLAVELVRGGAATGRDELTAALLTRSGLPELRALLRTRLAARADVLKARSALRAVDTVLTALPPADPHRAEFRYRLERLRAGAHELVEIDLLDRLRDGRPPLSTVEQDATERLLGGTGPAPRQRLGLSAGATGAEVRAAAARELDHWQRRAEHPATARDLRDLARTAVRTCEALLTHPGTP